MVKSDNLRFTKMSLNNGSGAIPALGFGTLIPDPVATRTATKAALEAGFRQLDASERYRNEKEVGGTLTLSTSTISDNSGTAPYGGAGGGIYNSGTMTVDNCTLADNYAGNGG